MRFDTPIFGFCLSLLKNPIDPVRAELMKLFDLLNGNNGAVGFVLLNGQITVSAFNGCVC